MVIGADGCVGRAVADCVVPWCGRCVSTVVPDSAGRAAVDCNALMWLVVQLSTVVPDSAGRAVVECQE